MLHPQQKDTGGKNSASQGHKLVCLCLGPWKKKNLSQICVSTGLFPCRFAAGIHTIRKYQKVLRLINEKLVQRGPMLKAPLADGRSKYKFSLEEHTSTPVS